MAEEEKKPEEYIPDIPEYKGRPMRVYDKDSVIGYGTTPLPLMTEKQHEYDKENLSKFLRKRGGSEEVWRAIEFMKNRWATTGRAKAAKYALGVRAVRRGEKVYWVLPNYPDPSKDKKNDEDF